ncbi:MAG: hypothetical protein JKY49_04225 [Cohaesibacteraceae bacterium]|nr:hypothetical protein [Cohaesibacteraceae bacterium]MBL4876400.1 hypothetical protein [Cohaesibacteraceae bacterium]
MIIQFEMYFRLITTIASVVTASMVVWIFYRSRRQHQFDFLEKSFDVLQRLNEKALSSSANLEAVVKSGNITDKTKAGEARILYFHYMRINRTYRAYEYWRGGYISKEVRDRISDPYWGSYRYLLEKPLGKSDKSKLERMLERGYPKDFAEWFIPHVESSKELPVIND